MLIGEPDKQTYYIVTPGICQHGKVFSKVRWKFRTKQRDLKQGDLENDKKIRVVWRGLWKKEEKER